MKMTNIMLFSNSTKCSLLCYLSSPSIPALKKSNHSFVVLKLQYNKIKSWRLYWRACDTLFNIVFKSMFLLIWRPNAHNLWL